MKFLLSILSLMVSAGILAANDDTEDPTPDKIIPYKNIGDTELNLHVFLPEDHDPTDRRPAIVFFFGGGWNGGSPTQFYPQCEYLASRGMVALSAEYRVKRRNNTSPKECVKDGKSAIRWIRQHASELGIDPTRIAAGGGSAGGHVAAAAGTSTSFVEEGEDMSISSRPDALVLFNPVYDNGPGGYGHDRVEAYWQEISPMHNISETTPPAIVFFGTKDRHVPVATAEEFKKRMIEKGLRSDLHLYEDQPHGFFNRHNNEEAYEDTMIKTERFLTSVGILPNESSAKQ